MSFNFCFIHFLPLGVGLLVVDFQIVGLRVGGVWVVGIRVGDLVVWGPPKKVYYKQLQVNFAVAAARGVLQ